MARRYGWTLAIGKEDQTCPYGSATLGFVPPKPEYLDGSIAEATGIATAQFLARTVHALPRLEYGKYSYLLLAPLAQASFQPHLVLVYGNPAQVMTLIRARLFLEGGSLPGSSIGGIGCAPTIAGTILSDECQYIVSGVGDRIFGGAQDHEMAFTLPPSKMESTVRGLEAGHRAGALRYPTPSYLRGKMELPPSYNKLQEFLSAE